MQIGDKKFIKTKFDSLDGKTVVAFTSEDSSMEFRADRAGIKLSGTLEVTSQTELDAFAKAVADTWIEYLKLKPKLHLSASGH